MNQMPWWKTAVFYQIYPRSFADGNEDGIGDLAGMISRLDYLKDLGVDAVWLSPHFPSPMEDCGYDISDYYAIAPEYGTMEEFKIFLDGLHERGMHLVLDLVLNHTSDQHPWFLESKSSKESAKRDWYIWRPGNDGKAPNDWFSTFGGSAWELERETGEYYYHFFFKGQPDLNWRNPEVKKAMFDVVRFWLDMGVDGFRLDAVGTIYEDPEMPAHGSSYTLDEQYRLNRLAKNEAERKQAGEVWEQIFQYQHDQPGVHALMKELRSVVDEYPERVLIGETDEVSFYGEHNDELHLNFNFPLMKTNRITPDWVRKNQQERLSALPEGGWPCNTLGNHDCERVYSSYGDGVHDDELARLHLALMLTLRGTPFLYNGEEIGMRNMLQFRLEQYRDPLSNRSYHLERRLMGATHEEALATASQNGRDKCRTPMQWSYAPNGGFCPADVTPWLPVNMNYVDGVNVADQISDSHSIWHFYRTMLHLRKQVKALQAGDYFPIFEENRDVLAFLRRSNEQTVFVALNFSDQAKKLNLEKMRIRTIYSSGTYQVGEGMETIVLTPFEVFIGEVQ